MAIGSTRGGLVKRTSRYEYAQAWSNQRKRMAQAALADNQFLANSLVTLSVNLVQGMADISTRVAVKRITEETKKKFEKLDELQSATNSIDISA
jgi:hypothetical protein